MFTATFLQLINGHTINAAVTPRSMLFAARAAMRCDPVTESPSISPMTAALVSIANQRTECPGVPDVFALVTADVEATPEAPELRPAPAATRGKKREKKPKSETRDEAPRKRSRRKSGGTRNSKTEPGAAIA
jgi:hypothetical protein